PAGLSVRTVIHLENHCAQQSVHRQLVAYQSLQLEEITPGECREFYLPLDALGVVGIVRIELGSLHHFPELTRAVLLGYHAEETALQPAVISGAALQELKAFVHAFPDGLLGGGES